MSRTLIDISRQGTDTTWPSVAVEVNGYLGIPEKSDQPGSLI